MRRRILVLALIAGAVLVGTAIATPVIGVTAETARGGLGESLRVNTKFDNGARVKLHTKGPIEVITQRIVAQPGATFGWHSHPGENVNVVLQGTVTIYHAKKCTKAIPYAAGSSFATHPKGVHLARNESATETVILYATYIAPKTTPALPVRIDEPSPGPECPQ